MMAATAWGSLDQIAAEPLLRLAVFALVFAAMAALELASPRRKLRLPRARRWITNVGMAVTGSVLVRLMGWALAPLVAVGAAALAAERGWGLLNQAAWPPWAEVVIAVVVLDLAIWLQHMASHKIPLLWRLHRMHHADVDFDLTTGIRFHPVENGLSMLWKVLIVLALGPPVLAVVLFEVILNGCAMFNHANVRLPPWLDRALRLLIVTPDMHRVHHSIIRRERDSNYGFNLSIWDRMLGTYTPQPEQGHEAMTIGLAPYQSEKPAGFAWSLALPFGKEGDR